MLIALSKSRNLSLAVGRIPEIFHLFSVRYSLLIDTPAHNAFAISVPFLGSLFSPLS
jgi:hypothetical protein